MIGLRRYSMEGSLLDRGNDRLEIRVNRELVVQNEDDASA
jgi:hypothetical protein